MALAEIYSNNKCYRTASAIIDPIIKRKTDALNRNHNVFGRSFILKSRRIEIELAKEKKNIRKQTVKQVILPQAYIQ